MNQPDPAAAIREDSSTNSRRTFLFVGGGFLLLIVLLLAIAVGIWMIPKGTIPGTRLVYEVDEVDEAAPAEDVVKSLRRRLAEMLNARVEVKAIDSRQVEVLVASQDRTTLEHASHLIESAGILRFLIVANPVDHATLIELATEQAELETSDAVSYAVHDRAANIIGRWVTVSKKE